MTIQSRIRVAFIAACFFTLTTSTVTPSFAKEKLKEPRPVVTGVRAEVAAESAPLLADLRRAKREGDTASVNRLHQQLGWAGAGVRPAPEASRTDAKMVIRPERSANALKWGGDTLVSDPGWSSGFQDMTCSSDGTFYVVTVDLDNQGYLDIYSSADGGATWTYKFSIVDGPNGVSFPSIAIGEGTYNRLLVAYDVSRYTPTARLVVFWFDLDDDTNGKATVDVYPDNVVGRPRICVDSPEYGVWYAYLTFARSSVALITHDLMFSRTIDYGVSWETPVPMASSLNSRYAHDIDFGAAGLFCAWSAKSATADVSAARSVDFGASFGGPIVLTEPFLDEVEPSVVVANTGQTVIVSYSVYYGGGDYDIEARVSEDNGSQWDLLYLPYNSEPENHSNLVYEPIADRFHIVYGRTSNVFSSYAEQASPLSWSVLNRVDGQQSAAYNVRHSIAADPTGIYGAGIAWMDARVPDHYGVYFDAANVINQSGVEYLAICPDSLAEAAAALTRYRQVRGYGVDLVTLSQIGPAPLSATAIDQFVETYALTAPQLRFLTLIGDNNLVPGFPVDDGIAQWSSDLRYADIDGDFATDYLPDIVVGRIPVTGAGELDDYIAKVKVFEQTFQNRNKVLFFGDQAEMSYVTNRDSLAVATLGYDVTTLYEPDEAPLLAALNDPALAMVLYYGHGSFATNWPLHIGNLDDWTNPANPVLYFSGGCNFNDNVIATRPLGHELLFAPGCATIAAGATVNGGYGIDYIYIFSLLYHIPFYKTMGELNRHAVVAHHGYGFDAGHDVSHGSWVYYFTERMMCHGDPALRIDGDVSAVPETVPGVRGLAQNYPNPFNPRTTIWFELPLRSAVALRIYDLEGRLVRTLLEQETRAVGRHEVVWDGRDGRGAEAPSGVYLFRLVSEHGTATGKMALVR